LALFHLNSYDQTLYAFIGSIAYHKAYFIQWLFDMHQTAFQAEEKTIPVPLMHQMGGGKNDFSNLLFILQQ